VLNLLDNPRVRVKLMRGERSPGRRSPGVRSASRQGSGQDGWRAGTAVLLPEDDVQARSRMLPYKWDAALGRAIATRPVTVRIDLDPLSGRGG
jgi:hypothetical protein